MTKMEFKAEPMLGLKITVRDKWYRPYYLVVYYFDGKLCRKLYELNESDSNDIGVEVMLEESEEKIIVIKRRKDVKLEVEILPVEEIKGRKKDDKLKHIIAMDILIIDEEPCYIKSVMDLDDREYTDVTVYYETWREPDEDGEGGYVLESCRGWWDKDKNIVYTWGIPPIKKVVCGNQVIYSEDAL